MTEVGPRDPRIEDRAHLAFVRLQACCVCGSRRNVEAAHLRMRRPGKETGMGRKPHDFFVTPLCAYHHRIGIASQHARGEREFWEYTGLNPFEIAERLWAESGGADRATERAANPKPAKPRKIKARNRGVPKRRIPKRALQSGPKTWPTGRKFPQSRNTLERRP